MHQWASQSNLHQAKLSLKQAILLKISPKKLKQNKQPKPSNKTLHNDLISSKKVELQLLEFILSFQIQDHHGYLGFREWIDINEQLWGDKVLMFAQQLWKIIRFINEGQVIIPTGLIYQVVNCLLSNSADKNLKLILEQFLRKNGKKRDLNSYRELRSYLSLQEILQGYTQQHKKDNKKQLKEQINTVKTFVNRASQNEKLKQSYLSNLRYQSLVEEMKNCPFQPEITQFASQIKRDKNEFKQKHNKCVLGQNKGQQVKGSFKAKPIDQQIYKSSVKSIPGAAKYIQRKLYCEEQRLRLKRFQERSVGNYK